ncbi:TIGR02450 family Trp-rich protein [Leptolyngbya sp. BC1307]|uniref:TIGR02450 family Trp-rich protein n=1 Tax=Leptolyngbya sp. BC1307 TaxID=2029589 RepID=UPI000EFCB885|nr:TIGR02450 family Trp-rich protein [Leptolyngbya sp. BC1307]
MAKPKFPHLVGSKWTAQQKTLGWRHFHVVNRKNQGGWVFAELVAACDPQARFWLNAKVLKNRQIWAAGWQTLNEIQAIATDFDLDLDLKQTADPSLD